MSTMVNLIYSKDLDYSADFTNFDHVQQYR
ncbi:hypothetical protein SAMN05518672_108181 [Chitinophaga sp. CF118]|nr:hypothetical protein SAMN05518672_108181 [Chitinophaga sp. CF118]